jgi:spore coat polysaccharide biosynthesis predicted glycosyltransferase SpsG
MNILWIDDFDRSHTNERRVPFVKPFGDFTKSIQESLDELGGSQKNAPFFLQDNLKKNIHPIFWYDGFVSGLEAIVEEKFDFVILDADLPIDEDLIEELQKEASFKTN